MKIILNVFIALGVFVILVSILNINYDELTNWEKNGSSILSLIACILSVWSIILSKRKRKSITSTSNE